jgi:hypothetical protein
MPGRIVVIFSEYGMRMRAYSGGVTRRGVDISADKAISEVRLEAFKPLLGDKSSPTRSESRASLCHS